ncbi:MAG: 3-oxoacyl-ACP synthase [Verrucomicrobia bacterium]|nr:3-oxoacyl-ACP synthase [Verrucomicrobiota bacterium]
MQSRRPPRPVALAATGVAVPERILTAEELDRREGWTVGESERVTGIRQRHTAMHETAAQLAAEAGRRALAAAGLRWGEVDALVCASATMDQALPYNAALVHAELGPTARRTATFDVGASCLSFLQALDLLGEAVAAGRYERVLIVSADISTFTTDYRNLKENGIFGDGAAAAVLRRAQPGEPSAILAAHSLTLPEGVDFCRIRSGGSRFHRRGFPEHSEALFEMRGRALYALVGRHLPAFVDDLLHSAGVAREELALLVPHQASLPAIRHVARQLGFAPERVVEIFPEFGNQVGASLPTALHFALSRHGLRRGDKFLLLGSGAGVSLGGMVLVY